MFVHVHAWITAGESLSTNDVGGFFKQVCSQASMHACASDIAYFLDKLQTKDYFSVSRNRNIAFFRSVFKG